MNELGMLVTVVAALALIMFLSFDGGVDTERKRAVEAGVAEYFVPKGETKPKFRYLVPEGKE